VSERWDAVVVGAGISGLAAAYELRRRGRRVLVLEADAVGAGQSAGLGRIFRVAHRDPRLCALALEARAGWRRWESELGAGRLLGDEGLVVAGEAHGEAMRAAGLEPPRLTAREIAERIPLLGRDVPWEQGIWDEHAGSLRIRRALAALARHVEVRRATVRAVEEDGSVLLGDGPSVTGDVVLVCAGLATGALVAPLGIDAEQRAFHHVRLTYRARQHAACLIAPEGYGLPLGSTGLWALGLHDDDEPPLDSVSPDAAAAAVRRRHAAWVPDVLPGLDPEPVGEIRCVSLEADWLDGGDGMVARRQGRVIAFVGGNLMKFGPAIGERLSRLSAREASPAALY
jgi:glycine/D-amino acid oxidase-like deaminating enzyme